jgi:hypothetical protein
MNTHKTLKALFNEFLAEVERNDALRAKVEGILGHSKERASPSPKQPVRRKPGRFDPMTVHRERPADPARRLDELSVDELKDIIAEHGMDRTKLAMKWKDKTRLVKLIIDTVENRAQKGDAFRAPLTDAPNMYSASVKWTE